MLLTILCTISLTWQATIAVHIYASRDVATSDQTALVVLPCNYTLENRNHSANIKWRCRDELVLEKKSLGQIRLGRNYIGRADMGEGCSLILLNPRPSDTNLYRVRITAPRDKHSAKQEDVSLVVYPRRVPKTSTQRSVEMTTSNDVTIKTEAPVTRMTDSTHDVAYFLLMVIYGAVWLLIHCLSFCKNASSGRIFVAVMRSRETSFWWKLTLVSTFVLLLVGTMVCTIGVIRLDWKLSLVGVPVTLMGTFVCVLCLILDARRPGKQATATPRDMMKDGSNKNLINPNKMTATDG